MTKEEILKELGIKLANLFVKFLSGEIEKRLFAQELRETVEDAMEFDEITSEEEERMRELIEEMRDENQTKEVSND